MSEPINKRWIEVCALDDIVPDTGVCALVQGEQVAVFRLADGSLHALANRDPFSHANVISRGIVGDLKGEVVVASPVYKQHFSLASGQCLEEPDVRLKTWPVREERGAVLLEIAVRPRLVAARARLVVVGNGMAGIRVLEELIKLAPDRYDITVFGTEPHGNYNRIMLSPVLAGDKSMADIVTHPERWYTDHGVKLFTGDPVMRIDRARGEVVSRSGKVVPYERLLLATGSRPVRIPLPGANLPGVSVFREISDVEAMVAASARGRRAVVIGGGLLGLEAAYGLNKRGMQVTVLHNTEQLMNRQVDATAADLLARHLEESGIQVLVSATTEAVLGDTRAVGVRLTPNGEFPAGREIAADLVVMAAGVVPNCDLARAAGIPTERGVLVNDTLQTYDPRIYAVGECVQHRGATYGLVAPLWEQARVCANHLAEVGIARYRGSVSATRLKVTGIELFSAGNFAGGPGTRDLVFNDAKRGVYKRLVLRTTQLGVLLEGAVLYGDAADGGWFLDLMSSGADVSSYGDSLLFGPRYADRAA